MWRRRDDYWNNMAPNSPDSFHMVRPRTRQGSQGDLNRFIPTWDRLIPSFLRDELSPTTSGLFSAGALNPAVCEVVTKRTAERTDFRLVSSFHQRTCLFKPFGRLKKPTISKSAPTEFHVSLTSYFLAFRFQSTTGNDRRSFDFKSTPCCNPF